ncbi:MMPL family transporter [Parvibaculum sp.]|uniref:efflux RND transporter permease subunit n=1 Tax=Parvibaculum sp. TaxID=2024848 RepID=UPI00320E4386
MIRRLENLVFGARRLILILLAIVTLFALYFAAHLRLSTGYDKALPMGHEYIDTFQKYRDQLFGSNSVIIVLEPRTGTIWNKEFFKVYKNLTDDIFYLPGVSRESVTSLWTPNVHYIEITEDGATAQDVIQNGVQVDALTQEDIAAIRDKVISGGFVGRVVANDFTGAMVWADMQDFDPSTGKKIDIFDVADKLEKQIRHKYENDKYSVRIIGFAKAIGDVADGARSVFIFFTIAFALTALSLYLYSRSWMLTGATLLASLTSVIWQFAALELLGFGLDPLAILVPFLVFAIGVSHGVQQINRVTAAVSAGASSEQAARASFDALLGPGAMALMTTFIGFATLYLIPIQMIRELAIAAAIGVAFKMVTNLVMLPLLVSYMRFDEGFAHRAARARRFRLDVMHWLGDKVSSPRNSIIILCVAAVLFTLAAYASRNRHVGALYAGVPELQENSRYNIDSRDIASKFSLGLNILTVVVETPPDSCVDYDTLNYLNKFSWHMRNVPGVNLVVSLPFSLSALNVPFNEGNLKWHTIPKAREALAQEEAVLPGSGAVMNGNCTLLPHMIFLEDARATTIATAVAAVKSYRDEHPMKGVNPRLAAGNMGVQAAVNEEVSKAELPMMLWVYAVVIALVAAVYRDLRAIITCCVPLTFATFLGYWFMDMLQIGLTVATLAVMVLAVGIGIDYAFYIYNRIQYHFHSERDATESVKHAMLETGMATFFTAVTLAIGVSTWAFSPLKFQADMGLLLTFMFLINMVVAITVLPAIVVVLDLLFPRAWSTRRRKDAMAH